MRDCKKYIELANLSVDGLLTKAENEELCEHTKCCDDCRRRVEAANAIGAAFSDMLADPPNTLAPGIKYKLTLEPSEKRTWRRFLPGGITVAAACVALLIIFSRQGDIVSPTYGGEKTQSNTGTVAGDTGFSDALQTLAPTDGAKPMATESDAVFSVTAGQDMSEKSAEVQTDDNSAHKVEAPAMNSAPQAPAFPDAELTLTGRGQGDSNSAENNGYELPIPEDIDVMGILVMAGPVPEELQAYERIEDDGFLYVLMPSGEFEEFAAENSEGLLADDTRVEAEAEQGIVVFYN